MAVEKLSQLKLTALEKIHIAREHRVAKLFKEGVKEIAADTDMKKYTLEEVAGTLGWEAAARILWVRKVSTSSFPSGRDWAEIDFRHLRCFESHCGAPISMNKSSSERYGLKCTNGHSSLRHIRPRVDSVETVRVQFSDISAPSFRFTNLAKDVKLF